MVVVTPVGDVLLPGEAVVAVGGGVVAVVDVVAGGGVVVAGGPPRPPSTLTRTNSNTAATSAATRRGTRLRYHGSGVRRGTDPGWPKSMFPVGSSLESPGVP